MAATYVGKPAAMATSFMVRPPVFLSYHSVWHQIASRGGDQMVSLLKWALQPVLYGIRINPQKIFD